MGLTLSTITEFFNNEPACRELLKALRWPNGVICPRCGGEIIRHVQTRDKYMCLACEHWFSVTSATAFHSTRVPLHKWFLAIYLMVESKKGMSAKQIERMLGVGYNTAWYMNHRIRNAMMQTHLPIIGGVVEIDETWVGGKVRGKGKGYKGNKAIVTGLVSRDGGVIMRHQPDRKKPTLHKFIREYSDADMLFSDDFASYQGLSTATVNHSIKEYVREWEGELVHTNTVESMWAMLKRSIVGIFHNISVKHLDRYLEELGWKMNHRDTDQFELILMHMLNAEHIRFQDLIGPNPPQTMRKSLPFDEDWFPHIRRSA